MRHLRLRPRAARAFSAQGRVTMLHVRWGAPQEVRCHVGEGEGRCAAVTQRDVGFEVFRLRQQGQEDAAAAPGEQRAYEPCTGEVAALRDGAGGAGLATQAGQWQAWHTTGQRVPAATREKRGGETMLIVLLASAPMSDIGNERAAKWLHAARVLHEADTTLWRRPGPAVLRAQEVSGQ